MTTFNDVVVRLPKKIPDNRKLGLDRTTGDVDQGTDDLQRFGRETGFSMYFHKHSCDHNLMISIKKVTSDLGVHRTNLKKLNKFNFMYVHHGLKHHLNLETQKELKTVLRPTSPSKSPFKNNLLNYLLNSLVEISNS